MTVTAEVTPETAPDAVVPVELTRFVLLLRTMRFAQLILDLSADHDALSSEGTVRDIARALGLLATRDATPDELDASPDVSLYEDLSPEFQSFLSDLNEERADETTA